MFERHFNNPVQAKKFVEDWDTNTIIVVEQHFSVKSVFNILMERVLGGEDFDDWIISARFVADAACDYFPAFEHDADVLERLIMDYYDQELLVLQQTVELSRVPKEPNWAYLTKSI